MADDSRHNSLYRRNAWFKALQTHMNRQGMTDWVILLDVQMTLFHIESTLQFLILNNSAHSVLSENSENFNSNFQ